MFGINPEENQETIDCLDSFTSFAIVVTVLFCLQTDVLSLILLEFLQMLSPQVPTLVGYLDDQSLSQPLLGALVDVSQASPSSLVSFLPGLRVMAHQCPGFLGDVAKIHGAVGIINEVQQHSTHSFLTKGYINPTNTCV